MSSVWWFIAGGLVLAGGATLLAVLWRPRWVAGDVAAACALFHARRQELTAAFLAAAARSGKPRGLTWTRCEFADQTVFARDRETGQLRALVAVTIGFEAVPDGGLEDNPHVDMLKAGTAVFLFDGEQWRTAGRAVFNLDPQQTLQHFGHELRPLGPVAH
jgi:hypothetical protein